MKIYVTPELYESLFCVESGFATSEWLDGESSSGDYSISSAVDSEFE